jgi:hypothetical protein
LYDARTWPRLTNLPEGFDLRFHDLEEDQGLGLNPRHYLKIDLLSAWTREKRLHTLGTSASATQSAATMSDLEGVNLCPPPFYDVTLFPVDDAGFIEGRLCQRLNERLTCCLPCPITDWIYPESFHTVSTVTNWIAAAGSVCCVFLLVSWAFLPVEKTNRHYLSMCLTLAVLLMNLGFVVPLAAQPDQCHDEITPNSMQTSAVCGASGALLMFGGWGGVMWAFLRSLSLHLQICWQVLVGDTFMWFAQAAGWGIPILGIALALVFSGVSFRFGATCHVNHENSLADFWIPLLIFAGATVIITFATFGYCIKVYLAALGSDEDATGTSSLPTHAQSVSTMTRGQAYRRVRRVISLQWRGIAIVLIIITDVIFFSIIYVFQDNVIQDVTHNPKIGEAWAKCLMGSSGNRDSCLDEASELVVPLSTITAVLVLLTFNGFWLLFLLGRWTMVTGWVEMIVGPFYTRPKNEFVSVDAQGDGRSYAMLSKETSVRVSTMSPTMSPSLGGRRTPDFFNNNTINSNSNAPQRDYSAHARSYSAPRPPQPSWNAEQTYAAPAPAPRESGYSSHYGDMNPLGMNRI